MNGEAILSSLRKIIRALNLESKRIQKELGLSIPQLLCLQHLSQVPSNQANTKELAEALDLNPSTISGIVSRLEKRGYLARLPKREDKRITYITLTAEGDKLLENAPQLFHQKLNERVNQLPAAEVEQIKRSLRLLILALEVNEIDASPILTDIDEMNDEV